MRKISIFILSIFILFTSISFHQQKIISPSKTVLPFKFDRTLSLRKMRIIPPGLVKRKWDEEEVPNKDNVKKMQKQILNKFNFSNPSLQTVMGTLNTISSPINNWDGIANINGVYPPDTEGDVGHGNYIQMVNASFQIWDKSGTSLYGPVDNSTLWDGFGDPWDGSNDGDPILLYDKTADRWLFSQFALPHYPAGPFYVLIAITETDDPLGSWYRYGFEFSNLPDYPKFGIWPDGYYMTINQFASGSGQWAGAGVAVFERDKMLNGDPNARMVFWDLLSTEDPYSMLPSNFDGPPPPLGTPNYMVYMNDDVWGYPYDQLRIVECSVDWNTTSNSTLTGYTILQTDPFDYFFSGGRNNISQPSTTRRLDAVSDRIMYRLQYRNFGSYQTLVTDHTIDVATDHGGVRWYELRNSGSGWSIYQQSTYAPDSHNRWLGSIAMDGYGNIALGYSISSSTIYPSIRYVGRYKNDPLGQMTVTEQSIISGTGSQTGTKSRWGDYSTMSVDPVDDATFWYTTEYVQTTGTVSWKTRVASFTLGFDLSIKVFLQGPYTGDGSMNTNLNSAGYLPTQQPFNSSPLSYSGVEKVVSNFFTSHNDIVDWVLVELRTGTSSSTIVAERAGLLKSNGMIVGLDGVSPLRFGLPTDDYYMVIRHRNHLAIMSSIPVTMSNYPTINSYNFTDAQNKAYTLGPNPMADLGSGKYGMYTGDGNANGSITASDNNSIWLPQFLAGVDGYKSGDYNMNGSVTASDNNSAWLINFLLGANSQVP